MTARTAAERKRSERERRKNDGLVRVDAWVHPLDLPSVRAYIERKNRKRAPDQV